MMLSPKESTSQPTSSGKKISWQLLTKIVLTATILFLICKNNDWAKFASEFKNAHPLWILLGFINMGLGIALGTLRWNRLLLVQGINLTYPKTAAFGIIGVFFSQFLPASTGGDVIKVFYILKEAPDRKARAALSIVIDRVLGLLAILLLTLILVPFEYQRMAEHAEIRIFIIILALIVVGIFCGLLLLWFIPPSALPSFCQRLWTKMPKKELLFSLYEGFQAHRKFPHTALSAVLTAIIAVVPVLSTGYFIAKSLDLDVHYPQMTIIFSLVICSMSIPISFGGHGLREGAFTFLFAIFNITRDGNPVGEETALACSTLFLAITVGWSLVGGLVYILYSHNNKKKP